MSLQVPPRLASQVPKYWALQYVRAQAAKMRMAVTQQTDGSVKVLNLPPPQPEEAATPGRRALSGLCLSLEESSLFKCVLQ